MPFRTPQIFPILENINTTVYVPGTDNAIDAIYTGNWNDMARFQWLAKEFDVEMEGNFLVNPEGTPDVTTHIVPFTYTGTIDDRTSHTSVLDLASQLTALGANSLYRGLISVLLLDTGPLKTFTDPGDSTFTTYRIRFVLSLGASYAMDTSPGSMTGTQGTARVTRVNGSGAMMDTSIILAVSSSTDGDPFSPYENSVNNYAAGSTGGPLHVGGMGLEDLDANYAMGSSLYTASETGVSWSGIHIDIIPSSRLTLP